MIKIKPVLCKQYFEIVLASNRENHFASFYLHTEVIELHTQMMLGNIVEKFYDYPIGYHN